MLVFARSHVKGEQKERFVERFIERNSWQKEIIQISNINSQSINGGFILGTGSINSNNEMTYYMYLREADDRIKLFKINDPINKVTIYDNSKKAMLVSIPFVETILETNHIGHINSFYDSYVRDDIRYEIHVPPGSIEKYINIGLQDIK